MTFKQLFSSLFASAFLLTFVIGCAEDVVSDPAPDTGAEESTDDAGTEESAAEEAGDSSEASASSEEEHHYVVVNDENFEEVVLKSDKPVLVDFWAPWCGPCRMISPVVESLAKQYHGDVVVAKLDVDEAPETAAAYEVTSIPYLAVFKNGEQADAIVGVPGGSLEAAQEEIEKRMLALQQ